MRSAQSPLRRLVEPARVLRFTPWFALLGVIAAVANLLLGNHITVSFWIASMAVPGLLLDLLRMLTGQAWQRREGWITWRTVGAIVIVVAISTPLESVLDRVGGYQPANELVNTDWSQLSDAVAFSLALVVSRQFLQWSRPKARRSSDSPAQQG